MKFSQSVVSPRGSGAKVAENSNPMIAASLAVVTIFAFRGCVQASTRLGNCLPRKENSQRQEHDSQQPRCCFFPKLGVWGAASRPE